MENLNELYSLLDNDLHLHEEEVQGTGHCAERGRDKGFDSQKECKDNDKTAILGSVDQNNEDNINDAGGIDILF
jgi:hypothetical protein